MSTQPDDPNSIHLTGREVALAAAADFSSFFLPGSPFAVPIHFGPVGHPLIRKDPHRTRIVLPNEMASDIIEKADRLFLHLLMLGHEIAHLVHRHLDQIREQSDDDYYSLELWADFYGAKVAMTIATHGPRIHSVIRKLFPDGNMSSALES